MKTSVIVIGLGAMGSATAQHLAARGHKVLGFDQFAPPHTRGSSHGETRIIRQAYWEDSRYVPLLLRAYELWRRLEIDSGQSLLHETGGLMIGRADGDLVRRSTESAFQFNLPHKVLSHSELKRLYPMFTVEQNMAALWEESAGFLYPEACIQQQLNQASRCGAELHLNEGVIAWEALPAGGVAVRTSQGTYNAARLVITAGPWAPEILSALKLPLQVTRQVLFWLEPVQTAEMFREGRFPVFLLQPEGDLPLLYGFPSIAPDHAGVKVALHGSRNICTADTVVREILPEDEHSIRERLSQAMPALNGRLLHAETCLYTMTSDEHFIIDKHPEHSQVTVAAGFSGHGFKFANVVGEILCDLSTDQPSPFDLGLFSLQRFQKEAV